MTQTARSTQSFPAESHGKYPPKVLVAVGILTLAGSLLLLWRFPDTFYPDLLDRAGDQIAEISVHENDVRLKPGGTLVWSQSREGLGLFHKDSIATMVGSHATIVFNDGSEIVMEPDSMIVIEEAPKPGFALPGFRNRRIQVKVHRGSFRRQKSGSGEFAVVPADGTELGRVIELDPQPDQSVFRVVKRTAGVEVFSESGKVEVSRKAKDGKGSDENALVSEGERLKVEPTEVLSRPSKRTALPAPKLKKPQIKIEFERKPKPSKPSGRIWNFFFPSAFAASADDIKVRLSWEKLEGASGYRVQISDKPRFTGKVESKDLKEPTFEKTMPASAGKKVFYLRVAGIDADGNEGEFTPAEKIDLADANAAHDSGIQVQVTRAPIPKAQPKAPAPAIKPSAPVAVKTPEPVPSPRAPEGIAEAKPSPTPSPIAKAPELRPSPTPTPKYTEEAKAVSGIRFRSELSAGASYAYRKFVGSANPLRAIGKGLTPGILSGEIYLSRMMRPPIRKVPSKSKILEEQDPDFSKEWLHLSIRAALQQASPNADALSDQAVFVPIFVARAAKKIGTWTIFGKSFFSRIGIAAGLSSGIQWDDILLKGSMIPLAGVTWELESDPDSPRLWNSMIHLTPWVVKKPGIEFGMTFRRPIPKSQDVNWRTFRGLYAQIDPQFRYISPELGWSIGIGVGYGL